MSSYYEVIYFEIYLLSFWQCFNDFGSKMNTTNEKTAGKLVEIYEGLHKCLTNRKCNYKKVGRNASNTVRENVKDLKFDITPVSWTRSSCLAKHSAIMEFPNHVNQIFSNNWNILFWNFLKTKYTYFFKSWSQAEDKAAHFKISDIKKRIRNTWQALNRLSIISFVISTILWLTPPLHHFLFRLRFSWRIVSHLKTRIKITLATILGMNRSRKIATLIVATRGRKPKTWSLQEKLHNRNWNLKITSYLPMKNLPNRVSSITLNKSNRSATWLTFVF